MLSPVGTTEYLFQPSLRDSAYIPTFCPSTKVLGYFQLSLSGQQGHLIFQTASNPLHASVLIILKP
jgi:hypothetical protein